MLPPIKSRMPSIRDSSTEWPQSEDVRLTAKSTHGTTLPTTVLCKPLTFLQDHASARTRALARSEREVSCHCPKRARNTARKNTYNVEAARSLDVTNVQPPSLFLVGLPRAKTQILNSQDSKVRWNLERLRQVTALREMSTVKAITSSALRGKLRLSGKDKKGRIFLPG